MLKIWDRIRSLLHFDADPSQEAGPRLVGSERTSADPEKATEALGTLLTCYGRHSFDLDLVPAEDTARECERWARHLTVGSPPPGGQRNGGARDWAGMQAFFTRHRKREQTFVVKALADLRDALWGIVRNLGETLSQDKVGDERLSAQVDRLRRSVTSGSTAVLKREVLAVADEMNRVLAEREEEQHRRMKALSRKMRAMREELEKARHGLETDPLTKVYNRAALDQQLERVTALNLLSGHPACVAMLDIDHFKQVNDSFGHPAGDEVLRRLANHIVGALPRKTDFIARYGGEEFTIIFQQDGLDVALPLTQRLLEKLRELVIEHDGKTIMVTASIGLAAWDPAEEPSSWLARADEALYRAKAEGRDRVVIAPAGNAALKEEGEQGVIPEPASQD